MANLSKASNVVQEKYILYDVTGFTQKWPFDSCRNQLFVPQTMYYVTCYVIRDI